MLRFWDENFGFVGGMIAIGSGFSELTIEMSFLRAHSHDTRGRPCWENYEIVVAVSMAYPSSPKKSRGGRRLVLSHQHPSFFPKSEIHGVGHNRT